MNTESVLAICLFGPWLAAIVCQQVMGVYASAGHIVHPRWRRRLDILGLGLCPRFTFFARMPVHYHLLYRDQSIDGLISPWNVVPLPPRANLRFIWNPGRRKRFALEGMCHSLLSHIRTELFNSEAPTPLCFAYLALACCVAEIPRCPLSVARQFMIAQSLAKADHDVEVLFISPLFSLNTGSEAQDSDVYHSRFSGGDDPFASARTGRA